MGITTDSIVGIHEKVGTARKKAVDQLPFQTSLKVKTARDLDPSHQRHKNQPRNQV
jgi:hypothetical protein